VEIGSYFSAIAGQDNTYRIYLPPCYGQNDRFYPTLYMFHGNIDTDVKWDDLGLDEAAENGMLADELPPFLIVMPDGGWIANNSSGGPYSFEGVILNELIPAIEATYCAWPEPDGRAIGGLSRGGYWSLEIAFRNPEIFSSVGGHSPALIDIAAGPDLDPIYTWEHKDLSRLRIFVDIGENDYLRANAILLHDRLTAGGIQHDWSLNEGGHEDIYWASRVKEYLTWYAHFWPKDSEAYPLCNITIQ
jgi:enterochelin esterase-like enzyme